MGDIKTLSNQAQGVIQVRGIPAGGRAPRTVQYQAAVRHGPGASWVVIDADGIKAALFVDALVGQHQVVIKSLEANYRRVQWYFRRHHHGRRSRGVDSGCFGNCRHGQKAVCRKPADG